MVVEIQFFYSLFEKCSMEVNTGFISVQMQLAYD